MYDALPLFCQLENQNHSHMIVKCQYNRKNVVSDRSDTEHVEDGEERHDGSTLIVFN